MATTSPQQGERARGAAAGRRRPGAWWLRLPAVAAGGFALYLASPPSGRWWLAPLAVAVLLLVVWRQRMRAGFALGLVFGASYLLPLLGWLQDFLSAQFGPWPWLGVALLQAVFFGLGGLAAARVSALPGSVVWAPAVLAAAEELRGHVPFGGFPWGKLAFTQTGGPYMALASVGGSVLVGFAVAVTAAGLARVVLLLRQRWSRRRWPGPGAWAAPVGAALVPVVAGLAVWPAVGTAAEEGTARVAAVQGNAPDLGLGLLHADDVLHDNHVRQARRLADRVEAGQVPRPDAVVLPEQVGSWGPGHVDPELDLLTDRLGVPVFVGGLADGADGKLRNQVVRWDPGSGPGEAYTKQHLVPFSETIPMRSVARAVTPFVDRFQQDMTPGEDPGVLPAGPVRLGVGICYDVAYDDVFTGAARQGANLLAVPTNNAWFGHSEMSYQQLAMSQLRAVQHGRAVVVAATSGVSAIVEPDGTVAQRTGQFTADALVGEVPLRSSDTLATRLGAAPAWIIAAVGAAAFALALRWNRRSAG
ncbi:apolipoprotein N-acyltransferase [Salinifilum aidingensis]